MKKNNILFLTILISLFAVPAYAQTPTNTASVSATPTKADSDDKEIQDLKDKIANKVAEIRKKTNQKATAGVIKSVKDNVVSIQGNDDSSYEIKIDDSLTKIFLINGASKKEIKSDELEKDAYIIVTGPKLDKTINANYIYQDERMFVGAGKIIEANKSDFYLKVITSDKDTYTLDIESTTAQQILNSKTLEFEKGGFSKIKEGDSVHFVIKQANPDQKTDRYAALKVHVIPQEYFQK